jgi:hemoglobin
MTLLDEIGGRTAVEYVVADFYDRVLADSRLAPFFRGVSMARLQMHQIDFMCAALGGGDNVYRGRDMVSVHAPMHITDHEFDLVVGYLGDSLSAAGVPMGCIESIVALLEPLRAQIVSRAAARAAHQ